MRNQQELKNRIIWSLALLFIVEFGKYVTLPFFSLDNAFDTSNNLVVKLLSSSTGGNFVSPTLFSLGIGPYMTGLIVWTTISMINRDSIANLSKKQIGYIQRGLTTVFAVLQGIVLILKFRTSFSAEAKSLASISTLMIFSILILTAGSLLISWLADINIKRGIGGQSLLVLPGLLSNVPAMLFSGREKNLQFSPIILVILLVITLIYISVTLFFYNSEYRINVEKTGIDSIFSNSYIPIRFLPAGAMPFMFAVTVFSMPQLLFLNNSWTNTAFSHFISVYFSFNSFQGALTYGLTLYLLGIGFSFINVQPHDIAKNLKESGSYILEVPPGNKTEHYIRSKLSMLAGIGNIYLVIVSVIPLLIGLKIDGVSNLAFYFGSIFMLIIIIDTIYKEITFVYSKKRYAIFN